MDFSPPIFHIKSVQGRKEKFRLTQDCSDTHRRLLQLLHIRLENLLSGSISAGWNMSQPVTDVFVVEIKSTGETRHRAEKKVGIHLLPSQSPSKFFPIFSC